MYSVYVRLSKWEYLTTLRFETHVYGSWNSFRKSSFEKLS